MDMIETLAQWTFSGLAIGVGLLTLLALFKPFVLIGKPKNFIAGYRSYYSSYALLTDTKSYRDNLPSWRFPEGRKK